MTVRIINADALDGLRQLPDESVHCVVTSPPYFGLRDYGMPGQIGLEATPAEFVQRLVDVFREVRRVLRSDGTCWLNMGDSYNNFRSQMGPGQAVHGRDQLRGKPDVKAKARGVEGMKEKDLMLIPERLAIALCDDGWYIRARIIWHKPNPMPESVTDRPTKSHEHIWLMSKQPRYYYDAEAIKEEAICDRVRGPALHGDLVSTNGNGGLSRRSTEDYRNARDVWTIATQPFSEAHFATFPPDLAERCIKAGCPKGGRVLDPFGGAGTTGLVADRLQRDAILIELNPEYAAMIQRRLTNDAPLFAEVSA